MEHSFARPTGHLAELLNRGFTEFNRIQSRFDIIDLNRCRKFDLDQRATLKIDAQFGAAVQKERTEADGKQDERKGALKFDDAFLQYD